MPLFETIDLTTPRQRLEFFAGESATVRIAEGPGARMADGTYVSEWSVEVTVSGPYEVTVTPPPHTDLEVACQQAIDALERAGIDIPEAGSVLNTGG